MEPNLHRFHVWMKRTKRVGSVLSMNNPTTPSSLRFFPQLWRVKKTKPKKKKPRATMVGTKMQNGVQISVTFEQQLSERTWLTTEMLQRCACCIVIFYLHDHVMWCVASSAACWLFLSDRTVITLHASLFPFFSLHWLLITELQRKLNRVLVWNLVGAIIYTGIHSLSEHCLRFLQPHHSKQIQALRQNGTRIFFFCFSSPLHVPNAWQRSPNVQKHFRTRVYIGPHACLWALVV